MSLIDIEQNDVDISKLFEYKHELSLQTPKGDIITLYQRLVGDEYNNQGRVKGLRASAILRENLRNTRWPDRKAYLIPTHKYKKDEIIDNILSLMITEITLSAINNTQIPIPKKPSGDADLEEQERYQKKVDEYKEKFSNAVSERTTKELERQRKRLNGINKDKLITMYESALINDYAQKESSKVYYEFVAYHGTFLDDTYETRITETIDEFKNLPTTLKEAIIEGYKELEIGATELKK